MPGRFRRQRVLVGQFRAQAVEVRRQVEDFLLAAVHAHLRAHLDFEHVVRRAQRDRADAVAEEVVEGIALRRRRVDAQAQSLHLLHAGQVSRRDAHEVARVGDDALVLVG